MDEIIRKANKVVNPDAMAISAKCETLSIKVPIEGGKSFVRLHVFKPRGMEPLG